MCDCIVSLRYKSITSRVVDRAATRLRMHSHVPVYNNYAYTFGVPGGQNVAAYSTRQSAAAAASYNPLKSAFLAVDDADLRPVDGASAERDLALVLTSPSYRRPTPGGASSCLDRSSADIVPPPPSTSTPRDRLTSPAARSAHLSSQLSSAPMLDSELYSLPLDRVAVHVDADDDDDDARQQHARSHSAPAAPRRHPAATDHRHTGPSNSPSSWYLQLTSPSEKRTDTERRLMPSPPPPPSAALPAPRDSTTNVRCRRTFPLSDVEVNGGPVVADTARRPNSASLPADSGATDSGTCSDAVFTRRRLRATRGRLNLTGDCGLASTLASMAIVAVVALVFSAVGIQLLLRLTASSRRAAATHDDDDASLTAKVGDSLLPAATSRSDDNGGTTMITRTVVEEVTVALAAVTVALDLCCLLTLSMQCFLAVKLIHGRNAEIRFDDSPNLSCRKTIYANYERTDGTMCLLSFSVGYVISTNAYCC